MATSVGGCATVVLLVTILAIRDTGRSETIASGTPPGEAMTTPIEQIAVEYSGWGHRYEDYHRRSMNLA